MMKRKIYFTPKKKNKSTSTVGEKLFLSVALLFTFFILTLNYSEWDIQENLGSSVATTSLSQGLSFFNKLKDLDFTPSLTGAATTSTQPISTPQSLTTEPTQPSSLSTQNTASIDPKTPLPSTQHISSEGYNLGITAASPGPDTFGYKSIENITYAFEDISTTGTDAALTDDSFVNVNIGMNFQFYGGITYTTTNISSNGYITFGGTPLAAGNSAIPGADGHDYFIAPFWDDLNPTAAGKVYYETRGTSPARRFIVQWHQIAAFQGGVVGNITFQAVLYETNNQIAFYYNDSYFDSSQSSNGGSATIGIENIDGTDGLEYSFNTQSLHNGSAILFYLRSECGNLAISNKLYNNIGTGSYCVNITASHVTLDCQGYNITYGGHSVGNGVEFQGAIGNVTIKNCHFFQNVSLAGSGNIGSSIAVSQSFNNTFFNNTFYTQTDKGTIFLRIVNDTNISWNTFRHQCGAFAQNITVFDIQDMYNGYIDNNNINTTCEGQSTGAISYVLGSYAQHNISLRGNIINTTGVSSTALTINGLTTGSTIQDNRISMYGNKSVGMTLKTSTDTQIRSNNFQITHPDVSAGILLNRGPGGFSVNNSLFDNNIISTNGRLTPLGIGASNGALVIGTNILNNVFVNNNISAPEGVWEIQESGDTNVNYLIYNNSFGEIAWQNNGTGGFLQNLTLFVNGSLALGESVYIANNTAALNTSTFTPAQIINSSANITLRGVDLANTNQIFKNHDYLFNSTQIIATGFDCNATGACSILGSFNGNIKFNTTGFSSFAANQTVTATPSSSCGTITTSTILLSSITSTSTCIHIGASNIFLDCAGYTITYSTDNSILGYGINNSGYSNVTIKNCKIVEGTANTNNKYAIYYLKNTPLDIVPLRGTIFNNSIITYGSNSDAIQLEDANFTNVSSNIINTTGSSADGIFTSRASNVSLSYNNIITFNSSANNIVLAFSPNSLALSNNLTAFRDSTANIEVRAASGTTFSYNNLTNFGETSTVFNFNSAFVSDNLTISSNEIRANGSNAWLILLQRVNNSLIDNNKISGTSSGIGIYLSASSENIIVNNNISVNDSLGTWEIRDDNEDIGFVNYLIYNNSLGELKWINNGSGSFVRNLDVQTDRGLGDLSNIFIGNNTIALNASAFQVGKINSTANLTLKGLALANIGQIHKVVNFTTNSIEIQHAGPDCVSSGICSILSYSGSTLKFNTSTFSSFAANLTAVDSTPPRFDPHPANQTIEANTTFLYDINATDNIAIQNYSINYTSLFTINSTGAIVNSSPILSLGTYYFNISINDTSNNVNWTFFQLTVQDTTPPRFDPLPTNQTIEYSAQFEYDINATDNIGIQNFSINYTTLFAINNTGGLRNISAITALGTYYFNISINDSSNNVNWTFFNVTIIDTTIPRFDPHPVNQTIEANSTFLYDINATDALLANYSINYTSQFTINSTGAIVNSSSILSLGTYYFNISINDTSNNVNWTFFQLTVQDTAPPRFDPHPTNQTIEYSAQFEYDINATDNIGIQNFSINYTTLFAINNTGGLRNISSLSAGTYIFNISINDTSNNVNWTFFQLTVQDTTPPRFDPFPTNQTLEANTTFFYDFNATDLVSLVTFSVNDTAFNINSTGGLVNSSPLQLRTYVLNITINDTSNNKNSTYFQITIQDTAPPRFDPLPTNQTIASGDNFVYNINATDNIGIQNFSINYTTLFAINNTGGLRNISSLSAGTYVFNISINDTSNNRNSTFFSVTMQAAAAESSSSSSSGGGGSSSSETAAPAAPAAEVQNPTQTPDAPKSEAPAPSTEPPAPSTETPSTTPAETSSATGAATTTPSTSTESKPFAQNFAGFAFFANAKNSASQIGQKIAAAAKVITLTIKNGIITYQTSLLAIISFIALLTLAIYNMPTINRTLFGKSTILVDRGINIKTSPLVDTITTKIIQKPQQLSQQLSQQSITKQKLTHSEIRKTTKATYEEELYTIKESINQLRQPQSTPQKPITLSSRTTSQVSSSLNNELRNLDNRLQGYTPASKIITETPVTKAKWDKSLQTIENQLQNIEQPFPNKGVIKTSLHKHYPSEIQEQKNILSYTLDWINKRLQAPEQKTSFSKYSKETNTEKTIIPATSTTPTITPSQKIETLTTKTKLTSSSSKHKKDYNQELSSIEETLRKLK